MTVQVTRKDDSATNGTIYSEKRGIRPFSTPHPDAYASFLGEERMERVWKAAERLKGLKLLEMNATATGGGVAEMLFGSIPFMNALGVEADWQIISGSPEYYETTKSLHNMLQGKKQRFTPEMQEIYYSSLVKYAETDPINHDVDVVLIHDPQPLGLIDLLKRPKQTWLWRCHIDIEEESMI
ncbi:MAG: hypothetical protein V3S37_01660, partial [Dehalococcoidia bacterium]